MFEIFIALFGSAYYGSKILSEKNNNYLRNKELEKWRKNIDDILKDRIPSKEEKSMVGNFIKLQSDIWKDSMTQKMKRCEDALDEDLTFIFGDDWRKLFFELTYWRIFDKVIVNLLYAQKLRLSSEFYITPSFAKSDIIGYGIDNPHEIYSKMFQRCEKYFTDAGIYNIRFMLVCYKGDIYQDRPKFARGDSYVLDGVYSPHNCGKLIRAW